MTARTRRVALVAAALALVSAALWVKWRFDTDLRRASARAAQGSVRLNTRCGPIEYQESATGVPLLAVHGSGGGHDQGMAFAGALASQGIRVIAMSRFGYLRTPMPADASAAAQADAHVCLLDALGIAKAAVMGGSAGAPSALQMAIRHPNRVSALVLLVPLAYKPPSQADSAPPLPLWVDALMMRLIGSDFLFWSALHLARDQVIKLGTRRAAGIAGACQPAGAGAGRRHAQQHSSGVDSSRGLARRHRGWQAPVIIPFGVGPTADPGDQRARRPLRHLASAQYMAGRISGAKFIGFNEGGHIWIGHDDEVRAAIVELLLPSTRS